MKETMSFSLDPYIANKVKTKKNQSGYVNQVLSASIGYDGLTNQHANHSYCATRTNPDNVGYHVRETKREKISRLKTELLELFEELENE